MKIVVVSDFFNHHQASLSEELNRLCEGGYTFVETVPIGEERKKLGWGIETYPSYVLCSHQGEEAYAEAKRRITEADAVITAYPGSPLMKERYRQKKLTFHYSEHLFKTGFWPHRYLGRLVKYRWCVGGRRFIHLLAASAHAAFDYRLLGLYRRRAYRWAYFPAVKTYDLDALMAKKEEGGPLRLLWVGRFIDWKHPERALETAAHLKKTGRSLSLTMVGTGALLEAMKQRVAALGLTDTVTFTGPLPPDAVREQMEAAQLYLFTSDRNEGWGAVLNEAMNSGCAVLADRRIGAVPFLLKHGENGLCYRNKKELFAQAEALADDAPARARFGRAACETMQKAWNAEVAARRVLALYEQLTAGSDTVFDEGPCSKIP